jgi:hypothetical protein
VTMANAPLERDGMTKMCPCFGANENRNIFGSGA